MIKRSSWVFLRVWVFVNTIMIYYYYGHYDFSTLKQASVDFSNVSGIEVFAKTGFWIWKTVTFKTITKRFSEELRKAPKPLFF